MTQTPLCQSCSRPFESKKDYGSDANGAVNADYCSCCYEKGKFTEPQLTLSEIVQRVAQIIADQDKASYEKALKDLPYFFKTLKRWKD